MTFPIEALAVLQQRFLEVAVRECERQDRGAVTILVPRPNSPPPSDMSGSQPERG